MNSPSSQQLDRTTISPTASIGDAIARLDEAGTGALILCSSGRKLCGLLSDGDIRRAVLRGVSLSSPCETIASRNPITARTSIAAADALHLMNRHDLNHLPVVDETGTVQDFLLRRDLISQEHFRVGAKERLEAVVVPSSLSIAAAMSRLDAAGTGALVLCAQGRRLSGLLTDGDIRRAILHGVSLEAPCGQIASAHPVTAAAQIASADALRLMIEHDISHLPVVDSDGELVEFLLRRDLAPEAPSSLSAVIMAGGFGTRLLPLTERVPKPMLPVGDRPLLERTIQQLRRAGISDVNLTTHYLPDSIVDHFGDGGAFGVKLSYSKEDHPLGTAGGLKLMKRPNGPFLVINGDILTGVSFQSMLLFHREHGAELTVGVRKYEVHVPFGVVECEDVRITQVREKPSLSLFINAGIYLLEPSAYDCIPDGQRFDMTSLVQGLLAMGRTVVSYPIMEYWLDVGRHEDYQKAQEDVLAGRI